MLSATTYWVAGSRRKYLDDNDTERLELALFYKETSSLPAAVIFIGSANCKSSSVLASTHSIITRIPATTPHYTTPQFTVLCGQVW